MIVVTGATGHVGNVLVKNLTARGEKVRVVLPPGEDTAPLNGLSVDIAWADVRDRTALVQAFKGSTLVYHLAGIVSILPGQQKLLQEVNVQGTYNVAEACLITGVGRLVYTSSIHALKEPPHGTAISESQPFDSLSVLGDYAKSKARASLIVKDAIRRGLDAVIVCPTGIIGPYDFKGSEMGQLVKSFVQRKLAAGVNGAYDFVDVRDVAAGLILAGEKGLKGETYILSGQQISVQDLFKNLEQISGVRAPRWFVPAWLARLAGIISTPFILSRKQKPLFTAYSIDVLKSNSRVDSQKARRLLGFTARPVYDSLRDTVNWFKEETVRLAQPARLKSTTLTAT